MVQFNFLQETIKPGIDFIKSIKPKDKIVIVHGHDSDSICSAVIFFKLIEETHKIKSQFIMSENNFSIEEKTIKKIKEIKPTHIIIVDIAEIRVDLLTTMRNLSNVLIVDHHIPKGYVKVTYVNPRIFDREIYLPATYLCFKIYEKLYDPKNIVWIAGIGTLADNGMKNCIDLFGKIKTINKELVDNLDPNDDILFEKALLGKLALLLESVRIIDGLNGSLIVLDSLIKVKDYKELLQNKKLKKCFDISEKEFKKLENGFYKNKKEIKNVLIYEIISKYNFKSQLASHLPKFFPDKIIIIYQKSRNFYDLSFRRGKSVTMDLNKLATDITKEIPNSIGGGHPSAAGGKIPLKYKNKLYDILKSI